MFHIFFLEEVYIYILDEGLNFLLNLIFIIFTLINILLKLDGQYVLPISLKNLKVNFR